ncbi:probable glutamate receptor [Haliotis asinina]|uniref:probable glutamate receptor n=1 Tax=Haliotis asinina TaxID=109174 RepID=UPI003531A6FB
MYHVNEIRPHPSRPNQKLMLNRILRDMDNVPQHQMNVLLLCNVTTTVSVLRQMGHCTKARMWTLMFNPYGRAFRGVVLWDGAVTNPTNAYPNSNFGYNGRELTVVMKDNHLGYGFVTVNKRRVYAYPFHLLKRLSQVMNFSYRVIPPREDEWGRNINGSWTGVFGMLQRREADLAADTLAMHSDRLAVSDYILPAVSESRQIILYKKEDAVEEDNLLIFLRPFQTFVYSMFGVSLITCISLLSFIRLIHNKDVSRVASGGKDTDRNMELDNNFSTATRVIQTTTAAAFATYGAAVKQGSTIESSFDSDRILVAGWWIFTTIFSAVYCGTIMTMFAVKSESPPFSNMAELAAREDYKMGYDSSSVVANLLQNSIWPDVVAVTQRVKELSTRDPDVLTSNITKHLQKVREGKYAFIAGSMVAELESPSCRFKAIDAKLTRFLAVFYLPRCSPFKEDFEKSMYLLTESGILQHTYQEWYQSTPDDKCQVEEYLKAVSLVNMQGIVFPVALGLTCGFIVLVAEIVWHKVKQKLYQRGPGGIFFNEGSVGSHVLETEVLSRHKLRESKVDTKPIGAQSCETSTEACKDVLSMMFPRMVSMHEDTVSKVVYLLTTLEKFYDKYTSEMLELIASWERKNEVKRQLEENHHLSSQMDILTSANNLLRGEILRKEKHITGTSLEATISYELSATSKKATTIDGNIDCINTRTKIAVTDNVNLSTDKLRLRYATMVQSPANPTPSLHTDLIPDPAIVSSDSDAQPSLTPPVQVHAGHQHVQSDDTT